MVGKAFSTDEFDAYCHTLTWNSWRPSFLVLHNTAVPDLSQEPNGFSSASMNGFVSYYRDQLHWSAGPHLFVDDHRIWVFTPMTTPGVHSPSWNNLSIGLEMLGDYATDAFDSGRGLAVLINAVAAIRILFSILGWPGDNIRLHREDPLTTHHCPGNHVVKQAVIQDIQASLLEVHSGEHTWA